MSHQAFTRWFPRIAGLAGCLACCAALAWSTTAWGQLPATRLSSIFPPGGSQGAEVELTLAGTDLDAADRLHFSHPGLTAKQKTRDPKEFETGPQPVPNVFIVSVSSGVPSGVYDVRAVGKFGISNPRSFAVSSLPEIAETEPNNSPETATEVPLGVVNGRCGAAADVDWFKFTAKAGQRLIIDCRAQRIDSPLDATLILYDAQGNQIDSDRDTNGRDPLIDFTAPSDGEYLLKLYDFVYAGGADYVYRLQISPQPYIDFVMPNAAAPGAKATFEVYGRNLPGGKPTDESVDGKVLEKVTVTIDVPSGDAVSQVDASGYVTSTGSWIDGFHYQIKGPAGESNPVLIGYAAAPIVLETEPNQPAAKAQQITLPCELVGRFQRPRDVDYIRFEAKQGENYWIEAFSQRYGNPTDPYLLLQRVTKNAEGVEQIADIREIDDNAVNVGGLAFNTAADDPSFAFTAPADGTYQLLIRDLYYNGDPRYVYRVAIRPAQPDFRLVALSPLPAANANTINVWTPLLRRGGNELIHVMPLRREGFNQPIEVSVEGLPPGVTCPPVTIGPSQNFAPLVLTAAENAKPWVGALRIVGKAKVDGKELARKARGGAVVRPGAQNTPAESRLTQEFTLAVSELELAPFTVQIGDGKPLEMSKAGTLDVPVKVTRRENFKGNVALVANAMTGMPNTIRVANLTLNANQSEGTIKVEVLNNALPEPLSFYMLATTQVDYQRNLEMVAKAEEYQKKIDGLTADADKAAKTAADEAKKATDAKAAADKAAADAAAQLKAAEDKAKAAADAAAKDPEKAELKAASEAAAKEVAAAQEKATAAKTAAEAAATAATAAEKVKTETDARLKMLQTEKAAAAKSVTDLKAVAAVKKINVFEPSSAIVLNVAPAPIKVESLSAAKAKQGDKTEVTVKIQRLFKYEDPVTLAVTIPGSLKGVKVANVTIEKGKNEAKLTVEADATATPGSHQLPVKATARFNNQNLDVTENLPLTIEAVEAAK